MGWATHIRTHPHTHAHYAVVSLKLKDLHLLRSPRGWCSIPWESQKGAAEIAVSSRTLEQQPDVMSQHDRHNQCFWHCRHWVRHKPWCTCKQGVWRDFGHFSGVPLNMLLSSSSKYFHALSLCSTSKEGNVPFSKFWVGHPKSKNPHWFLPSLVCPYLSVPLERSLSLSPCVRVLGWVRVDVGVLDPLICKYWIEKSSTSRCFTAYHTLRQLLLPVAPCPRQKTK